MDTQIINDMTTLISWKMCNDRMWYNEMNIRCKQRKWVEDKQNEEVLKYVNNQILDLHMNINVLAHHSKEHMLKVK
jgi:hypothetical protein